MANNYYAVFGPGTSAPTWASGKYGKGININGSNQYAKVVGFGNNAPTSEITISLWVYVSTTKAQSAFNLYPDDTANRINFHPCYNNGNTYWDFGNISSGGRLYYANPANLYQLVGTSTN